MDDGGMVLMMHTTWQAIRYLPDLITIRIFVNASWFTFFLVKDPEQFDPVDYADGSASLTYIPDPTARAPPTRNCPRAAPGADDVIDCEGVAESSDFVLRGQLAFEGDDDTLAAHITHAKYNLVHDLSVR